MSNLALQTAVASLFGGLLTCQQVAEILRIHPRTVQRLERTGALRGVRLGRRALIISGKAESEEEEEA